MDNQHLLQPLAQLQEALGRLKAAHVAAVQDMSVANMWDAPQPAVQEKCSDALATSAKAEVEDTFPNTAAGREAMAAFVSGAGAHGGAWVQASTALRFNHMTDAEFGVAMRFRVGARFSRPGDRHTYLRCGQAVGAIGTHCAGTARTARTRGKLGSGTLWCSTR